MSWSYNHPNFSARDWVRWRVGDTDTTDQLQQDEEIDGALAIEGNRYKAAATVAEAIAGKFARQADEKVGPLSKSLSQKSEAYLKLAKRLRAEVGRRVAPWAGGIRESDMDAAELDTDRVEPAFKVNQFETEGRDDVDEATDSL